MVLALDNAGDSTNTGGAIQAPEALGGSGEIAVFDFDGTITRSDSLVPFIRYAVGDFAFLAAILRSCPWLAGYALRVTSNHAAKSRLLQSVFLGQKIDDLRRTGRRFAQDVIPGCVRETVMDRARWHLQRGDICVIVSASLDVYVEPWANQNGFAAALCSRLTTDSAGRVCGGLSGNNCYGPEKVARFLAWLGKRSCSRLHAYGDSRGDRELIALADDAYLCASSELNKVKG